ncbi:MAG: HDOD domain-containing protein [Vitreoscilla sp.]|nr:HDOD domain-containing protein [Burkholderiales bacterium]MBP6336963.1 HDOD domain-containing protein [Vitreoscilla sp.]MBP6675137.1 HDOD domain-containing protein [Vitreoscilla sp.]
MNTPARIAPFVQRASSLPAMPEVAQKLLQSFDRDDLSLPELAALISRDQALSAKVLRLANSARYSPSRTVGTLPEAAASLGLRTLRDLTLSACMAGAFPDVPHFDRLEFWRGTLAVAAYAQPVARALDLDEDTAYLGGLVLRTGRILMLLQDAPNTLLAERQAVDLDSLIDYERAQMGCCHPEVSAALARHWRFPEPLVMAFQAAVEPLATRPFNRLGAALRLASVVADCRERGEPVDYGLRATHPALIAHLQLDLEWLEAHLPDHRLATAGVEDLMH